MQNTIEHFKSLLKAEQFIITGSYAFNLLGLTERKPNDLDIILVNPDATSLECLERLKSPANEDYPCDNMFRVVYNEIKIDFFIEKKPQKVIELKNGLLLATPKDTIAAKKSYLRLKDVLQLKLISELFYTEKDLQKVLEKETKRLN